MGERPMQYREPRQAGEPAPSRPHTELRRVTVTEHDERNGCETVRGVGFSWRCTCGERGTIYPVRSLALESKRQHEAGHQR